MKKFLKHTFSLLTLLSVIVPVGLLASQAQAINPWGDPFDNNVGYNSFQGIGMGNRDPRTIAANVINILLGMLGVVAVIIILYGGFLWMTAAGNDDNVGKAKQILGAGVIGLLIVLAAYAISIYILRSFLLATGAINNTGDVYQLNNTVVN